MSASAQLTDEEVEQLVVDVPVSLDGSWISRGADSKNGFVSVISQDTGNCSKNVLANPKIRVRVQN